MLIDIIKSKVQAHDSYEGKMKVNSAIGIYVFDGELIKNIENKELVPFVQKLCHEEAQDRR